MKNTERTGVDIRVALSSRAKLVSTQPRPSPNAAAPGAGGGVGGLRAQIKRLTRPVARLLFRIVRPVGRPIAFRSRAYLVAPLVAEIRQLREQIGKDLAAHKRVQQETTERLLSAHGASLRREIKASQHALQSQLAARGADVLIQRLLQPAGTFAEFGAHTEVQGAIAVLKIDAARLDSGMLDEIASIASANPHMALIVQLGPQPRVGAHLSMIDWQRAFEHLGLIAKAIDPESGALRNGAIHTPDASPAGYLFLAREGATAWQRAGSAS